MRPTGQKIACLSVDSSEGHTWDRTVGRWLTWLGVLWGHVIWVTLAGQLTEASSGFYSRALTCEFLEEVSVKYEREQM